MSTKLKKLVAQIPKSEADMEALVKATVEAQLTLETQIAARDRAQLAAAEPYAQQISTLQNTLAKNLELLEAWAEGNRDNFGKVKSMVVGQHRIGWHLGQWKTSLLAGTKSWKVVMEKLKALKKAGKRFIRVKEEPDKDLMIRFRHHTRLLARFGVEVIQEETFYLKPYR